MQQMPEVTFHAYSSRICLLQFAVGNSKFSFISCYFPTSWDDDGEIEVLYDLLQLIVASARSTGSKIVVGGDFIACIGGLRIDEDAAGLGEWGSGPRNTRGDAMVSWVLGNGFNVRSRQTSLHPAHESWTCQRSMDGARIQLDCNLADGHVTVQQVWHDYIVPIGLDHRCAHCILQWCGTRPPPEHRGIHLKNWAPKLDENGIATSFCNCVMEQLTRIQEVSCQSLEKCLVPAGKLHGTYGSKKLVFRPSEDLLRLRRCRRAASDLSRKEAVVVSDPETSSSRITDMEICIFAFVFEQLVFVELDAGNVAAYMSPCCQPHPNDFADMLGDIFSGNFGRPMDRPILTEAPWSMNELRVAIRRAKNNRTGDDLGLVAELLKHAPEGYLEALLDVFRHALSTGQIPTSWQTTISKMLPKSSCAKFASDFRPIASLRLLYKIFAYLMLGRMEDTLEDSQPEEQHGFRKQRKIEEHLLTANLCLQKTLEANIPLWIISLDLSKAFDKVNWEALWAALMQHGVSQHLVWILQCIYYGQSGKVREHFVDSRDFGIRAGVRQGCVLSPRLFCAVLEFAMFSWRAKIEAYDFNLHDGMKALLDLRFADDLLVFATSRDDTIRLLEELVTSLGQVGLTLNTSKTNILTTQAQPESSLQTSGGATVEVLDSFCPHKWLRCFFKQLRAVIRALTYSTICKQRHGLSLQIARFLRTTRFLSKIAFHFFMQ